MKKKLMPSLLGVLVFGFVPPSFGATYTSMASVSQVNINNHLLEVRLPIAVNPAQCSSAGGWYLRDLDLPGTKEMLSVILSARVSGGTIKLRVSGSQCQSGYPTFDYVAM